MTIIETRGGPVTHRYLMNKRRDDLARMYLDLLREFERLQAENERLREEVALENPPHPTVRPCCGTRWEEDCTCEEDGT